MSKRKLFDTSCKVLILGESKVGKSSILNRFTEKTYLESLSPTLGIDYKIMKMNISGFELKMQIWDTAGQERFRSITESFYKGCQAVLLVFDLTDKDTFYKIKNWLNNINEKAGNSVFIVLVGNKCDLKSNEDVEIVSQDEIYQMTQDTDIKYFATSAKEDVNIQEVFYYIARAVVDKEMKEPKKDPARVPLTYSPKSKKEKCCS